MRTLGIDLASSSAGTAACVIRWEERTARVEHLQAGVDDNELRRLASYVDKVGIDVPFGWPDAFVASVSAHHRMDAWPGFDSANLRLRRTDEFVWRKTRRQPLSVSADRLAVPAFRAARLLSEWQADRTGAGRFVEVYPRAARARFELGRTRSIEELQDRAPWLTLAHDQELACEQNADCFDALISSLVARASALHLCEPIPDELLEPARREGWIALPLVGSLEQLARSPCTRSRRETPECD
jgi:predicted nuclease with RNAse H fold